jgi:hypothetical protein
MEFESSGLSFVNRLTGMAILYRNAPLNQTGLLLYRVCQGLWPSLMFADEDNKLQNFWVWSKSHVATTYSCMHFCSNYIGWSNQGKYYEIEMHSAKQDVATLLYHEANIFQFDIFL